MSPIVRQRKRDEGKAQRQFETSEWVAAGFERLRNSGSIKASSQACADFNSGFQLLRKNGSITSGKVKSLLEGKLHLLAFNQMHIWYSL